MYVDDTPILSSEDMKNFKLGSFQFQWYNGYIVIPKEYAGKLEPDEIWVHGGISYDGNVGQFTQHSKLPYVTFVEYSFNHKDRIIGFDCHHFGDTKEICNERFVRNEIEDMGRQLFELQMRSKLCRV